VCPGLTAEVARRHRRVPIDRDLIAGYDFSARVVIGEAGWMVKE
jgi:hypothetical protein